jgi:hypothetical protein
MADFSSDEFAPLCVPVAMWPAGTPDPTRGRYIRLATGIQPAGLRLRSPLPEALWGTPLSVRLQLPAPLPFMPDSPAAGSSESGDSGEAWDGDLAVVAVPAEVVVRDAQGERAELRRLAFVRLPNDQRERIERYVTLRLLSDE